MSLRPRWHPAAEEQLKRIGWHRAEIVDAAVIRFARLGAGTSSAWTTITTVSASGSTGCGSWSIVRRP
jgi:hypothetical protein